MSCLVCFGLSNVDMGWGDCVDLGDTQVGGFRIPPQQVGERDWRAIGFNGRFVS